ncbi:hypothetical protein [Sphingopyxis sp. Geo48]|nr:hypothetical protein [Sphingopyxis sp. Geo48]
MDERIDIRGETYLRFECECGQRQQSPEPEDGKVKCARCNKEHTADE